MRVVYSVKVVVVGGGGGVRVVRGREQTLGGGVICHALPFVSCHLLPTLN